MKRRGGSEPYDEKKVYASIYRVCLNRTDRQKTDCEDIAETVTDYVTEQVEGRQEVLSVEIRMWTRNKLREIDEQLAQLYYTHHE